MKQSIKIDIIYYGVERDTKMEFELSEFRDMPIRTLSSSAADRNEFLYALKRAVYRSNTVVIVGGLTGNTYLPAVLASAVGLPLEKLDYKALGFAEPANPLMFPKGAIPLVSQDNNIGGLLIEKGRQSIILLSDNAGLRHDLLNALIYPYIFDIGADELLPEQVSSESVNISDEQNTVLKMTADIAAETAEEIAEEPMPEIADEDKTGRFVLADDEDDCNFDDSVRDRAEEKIESYEHSPMKKTFNNNVPSVSNGMFVIADDSAEEEENDTFSELPRSPEMENVYSSAPFEMVSEQEKYDDDDELQQASSFSFLKLLGVFVGIISVGMAIAIIALYFMGLL